MPSSKPSGAGGTPIDRAAFVATWGAEPQENLTLLLEYAKSNAKDLLALKRAVEEWNLRDIMDYAHRMAGASQIMGAHGIVSCCSALETAARSNDWALIAGQVDALRREVGAVHTYISSMQAD